MPFREAPASLGKPNFFGGGRGKKKETKKEVIY